MPYIRYILLLFILFCITLTGKAQTPHNIDQDIASAIPSFNCLADDYLQYSPAAVMLGLKTFGYEGRTGWGQMLTADAFSIAIMTGVTKGLKYAINRPRPDGNRHSFPSGHTAIAFMAATMLHKEYGWRSPWWSIGGYTVAAFTGVSRIMNNRHWMSDVAAGALIGTGAVHLGYYLSDLIFKGKHMNPAYIPPIFTYDPSIKHYVAEMYFGRRFILGGSDGFIEGQRVVRGGTAGLATDIPIIPGIGMTARLAANSLTYATGITSDMYAVLVGGFYNHHLGKRFEFQTKTAAGIAYKPYRISADTGHGRHKEESAVLNLSAAFSFMLDDNFKIKAFADYEAMGHSKGTWLHSAIIGWSTAWVW